MKSSIAAHFAAVVLTSSLSGPCCAQQDQVRSYEPLSGTTYEDALNRAFGNSAVPTKLSKFTIQVRILGQRIPEIQIRAAYTMESTSELEVKALPESLHARLDYLVANGVPQRKAGAQTSIEASSSFARLDTKVLERWLRLLSSAVAQSGSTLYHIGSPSDKTGEVMMPSDPNVYEVQYSDSFSSIKFTLAGPDPEHLRRFGSPPPLVDWAVTVRDEAMRYLRR